MNGIADNITTALSIISDPFKIEAIDSIALFYRSCSNQWSGWVDFKNGNTSGRQDLIPASDLYNMVNQMKAIIESLKK